MDKTKRVDAGKYQSGFANHFSTEAEVGALPTNQNSPQKVPYGLFAEQLNGTAFMAPRDGNRRVWLYRIRPSVIAGKFVPCAHEFLQSRPFTQTATPNQLRWNPLSMPDKPTDFIAGLTTIAGNGSLSSARGSACHIYHANRSMEERFFYNADGEMLIVPQVGTLILATELGIISLEPGEIAVIPCGIKFQARLESGPSRGYVCENYGPYFRLPQLGPIGSNGLAYPQHFLTPTAWYEDKQGKFELIAKFQGRLFKAPLNHSPLDVVAWHGNYAPYKYDLRKFQVINTVSFDHCDPSIYTVLTSPSELEGVANVDFVIFPPRWSVAEHTFRPAYFHRNVMSEFMGLIFGSYEAKAEGFLPGGFSLHNKMSAHGPDAQSFAKAIDAELTPIKIDGALAFMFESSLVFEPTDWARETNSLQKDYQECWQGIKSNFSLSK